MAMQLDELDGTTRDYMLQEFRREQAGPGRWYSTALSATGRAVFDREMAAAIQTGNEVTLAAALAAPENWNPRDARGRTIDPRHAAERLALTEFNTWYVRGFAKRLLDEQQTHCEIYRAAQPQGSTGTCSCLEGQRVSVQAIYEHHRIRYWPKPGDQTKISVPFDPSCHHTIRRVPGAPASTRGSR